MRANTLTQYTYSSDLTFGSEAARTMDWKYLSSSTRASSSACQNKIMQHNSPNTASTTVKNSLGLRSEKLSRNFDYNIADDRILPEQAKKPRASQSTDEKVPQHSTRHRTQHRVLAATKQHQHGRTTTQESETYRETKTKTHTAGPLNSSAGTTFCPTVFFFK